MPALDGPGVWKMSVGEKKELYGKHRIPVGGAAPADAVEEGGLDLLLNEMIQIIILSFKDPLTKSQHCLPTRTALGLYD